MQIDYQPPSSIGRADTELYDSAQDIAALEILSVRSKYSAYILETGQSMFRDEVVTRTLNPGVCGAMRTFAQPPLNFGCLGSYLNWIDEAHHPAQFVVIIKAHGGEREQWSR